MNKMLLAMLIPLSLAGCISYNDAPPPPPNTTVVVPPGSTITCGSTGLPGPC